MQVISMTQWRRVSRLLDELLEDDEKLRLRHLALIKDTDPVIASQLERLLAHKAEVEAAQFLEGSPLEPSERRALAGRVVGNYTLEHMLGAGGMGSVWLARRNDGRYEGRVAIKFLNLALMGAGGSARFRREGVALARLAHPNIAQLIDAGTDAGQPYLVLEYIEGQSIDQWCRTRSLGLVERIRLFLDVLAALAHAHGRLILHRDLKPSNIFVTADGRVKLLDFGVAKLLDDAVAVTSVSQQPALTSRAFTPEYAAPEQVRGEEMTTATDVYSMGVLLYVLLSGRHPTPLDGSPLDKLRAVTDIDPVRLSGAAQDCDADVAAERSCTPRKLVRELRGDLDNIVGKALKKRPGERYGTAAAFAGDLRRYLNHEPVDARADSLTYRTGKFIRRNRSAVSVGAAVLLAVLGGAAAVYWQSIEIKAQRDEALFQSESARANGNLFDLLLGAIGDADKPLTQREILERSAELAEARYSTNPRVAVRLLLPIAGHYFSLSDVEGDLAIMRRIEEIAMASGDPQLIADAACNTVNTEIRRGRTDLAMAQLHKGLQALARVDSPRIGSVVECMRAEADAAYATGDIERALDRSSAALRLLDEADMKDANMYSTMLSMQSFLQHKRGDLPAAYKAVMRERQYLEENGGRDSLGYLVTWNREAGILLSWGEVRDAQEVLETLAARWRGTADELPPIWYEQLRGWVLHRMGRSDEAMEILGAVVARARAQGNENLALAAEFQLTQIFINVGRLDEAGAALKGLESKSNEMVQRQQSMTIATLRAALQLKQGLAPESSKAIDQELARLGYPRVKDSFAVGGALRVAVRAHIAARELDKALDAARAAVASAEATARVPSRSADVGESLLMLAQVQRERGDLEASRRTAMRAADCLARGLGAGHRLTHEAQILTRT